MKRYALVGLCVGLLLAFGAAFAQAIRVDGPGSSSSTPVFQSATINGPFSIKGLVSATFNPNQDGNFLYLNNPLRVSSMVAGYAYYADVGSFTTAIGSGSNGFECVTEGCRFKIGPDTYIYETGTVMVASAAGGFQSTADVSGTTVTASNGRLLSRNANGGISLGSAGSAYVEMNPGAVEVRLANGGYLSSLTNSGTAGSGTGYTLNETGYFSHRVHKITIAETALTAAATTEDEVPWTIPAKTRVMRIIVDVTQAFDDGAGPISAVTITCGPSAGSAAYVASSSVFTVNTIGDVAAEIGTGLTSATIADIPSFSGTTAISCRFTSTGGNLSTLTTGSATFYIEHIVYP